VKLKVLEHFSGQNIDGYWIIFDEPEVTRAYLAAFWIRDALGQLLPDHEERRRLAYQLAAAPELIDALEATNTLALELMDRAARIDQELRKATELPDDGVELGEIVRLREQLGRNEAVRARAGKKG
jgi:hypothetical protein